MPPLYQGLFNRPRAASPFNSQNPLVGLFEGTPQGESAYIQGFLSQFRTRGNRSDDLAFAPELDNIQARYEDYFTRTYLGVGGDTPRLNRDLLTLSAFLETDPSRRAIGDARSRSDNYRERSRSQTRGSRLRSIGA